MAYRKASLSGAKRKAEESAKEADLAEAAKGPASTGERLLIRAHLSDQTATEEEKVGKGAADSVPPQNINTESAAPLQEEATGGTAASNLPAIDAAPQIPPPAQPAVTGSHEGEAGWQEPPVIREALLAAVQHTEELVQVSTWSLVAFGSWGRFLMWYVCSL
jgi:hypothetical protein